MPREHTNSRGRRNEKKLKRSRDETEKISGEKSKKKRNTYEDSLSDNYMRPDDDVHIEESLFEGKFYGLLGEEEQEYFRRSDELLELNDFPDDEQRSFFLANVFREAENKELKITCSQSCSRLMERLILLSTTEQKKKLFEKFAGNFLHLIQHRFASHCCEMLFVQSASVVTEELNSKLSSGKDSKDSLPSMETLFLQTLDELEGKFSSLLTDRFASHVFRVLLVILDGRSSSELINKNLLQSKRKEKVTIATLDSKLNPHSLETRTVPSSFTYAVNKIITDIAATMDQSFIRLLATHPTGNPTLQLLLELELTNPIFKTKLKTQDRTILSIMLPDVIDAEGSESLVLINGLLYDSIGSRLLETICTFAPAKIFKQIYQVIFKDRMAAIMRNEISSYTAICVLTRIGKLDLEEALITVLPQIPELIKRNRTLVVRALVERCYARNSDTTALITAIFSAYGGQLETLVLKMTCLDTLTLISTTTIAENGEAGSNTKQSSKETPAQLHGSLLAQSLLKLPGPPSELMQAALLSLPPQIVLSLSLYMVTSHIIQSALSPSLPVPFRRKLINVLLFSSKGSSADEREPVITLALSSAGSHVLDALFICTASSTDPANTMATTTPLFSYAERISSILTSHEHEIRNSFFGRLIWRNWSLDLFQRMRSEWIRKVKATSNQKSMFPQVISADAIPITITTAANGTKTSSNLAKNSVKNEKRGVIKRNLNTPKSERPGTNGKSSIQLAMERFSAGKGTGVNAERIYS